mgnify:CR=1 FL=1
MRFNEIWLIKLIFKQSDLIVFTISEKMSATANAFRIAKAGGDIIMPGSSGDYKVILNGLKTGEITREQLEQNATRVLHVMKSVI